MKRCIKAASAEAEQFGDLYDSGDYDAKRSIYEDIESILDKYGTENDLVTDIYDRADRTDKKRLMDLAKLINQKPSKESTKSKIRSRYNQLQVKSERGTLTSYEDGYFDALCDFMEAFDINF